LAVSSRSAPRCSPESNAKVCLITRIAFGFGSPDALIAVAMLNLGGHRPDPPRAGDDPGADSRKSVSAIIYISVIPDTEFGFFLEAARSSWCSS
jgi:hypothetical protein